LAIVAHGMARFLLEKFLYNSDGYLAYVCDKCGIFAQRANRRGNKPHSSATDIYYCPHCNNYNNISAVVLPFACKLMIHELMSMCIVARIETAAY
jgi:DNA-directed RNA polymerase II subunit RPB2